MQAAIAMTQAEVEAFINGCNPETIEGVKVAPRPIQTNVENPAPLPEDSKELTDQAAIARFILAGNATFTLVSNHTGVRYTYKVTRSKTDSPYARFPSQGDTYFVGLLAGPDNEHDYTYMGLLQNFGALNWAIRRTKASKVDPGKPSYAGVEWFLARVLNNKPTNGVTFYHAGKCGRCGRKLTVPESIEMGLGPECAGLA